jgi:GNAT superfamily N-acetyltransferase
MKADIGAIAAKVQKVPRLAYLCDAQRKSSHARPALGADRGDLFSVPASRGKGIGRRLIMEFYERAKLAGTIGVYWHTHSTNCPSSDIQGNICLTNA